VSTLKHVFSLSAKPFALSQQSSFREAPPANSFTGVATAAEASGAEAGSAAPGALAVGQERDEGHVIWSASEEGEGNADDITESTRKKKSRKAKKKGGLTSTAVHHVALPQDGWQDLEAGAPERAASPSPLTAQHHPQHIASPPALVPVVHGVPHLRIYMYTYVCRYTYIYTCICICIYECMYVNIYMHIFVCLYMYMLNTHIYI